MDVQWVCGVQRLFGMPWLLGSQWLFGLQGLFDVQWLFKVQRLFGMPWLFGVQRLFGVQEVFGEQWFFRFQYLVDFRWTWSSPARRSSSSFYFGLVRFGVIDVWKGLHYSTSLGCSGFLVCIVFSPSVTVVTPGVRTSVFAAPGVRLRNTEVGGFTDGSCLFDVVGVQQLFVAGVH